MNKKRVFIIAGVVLLIVAVAAFFILRSGFKPSEQDKQAIEQALDDEGKAFGVNNTFRMEVDPSDLSIQDGLDEKWVHVLLMGTDGWASELNEGRADAMIIASLNIETKEIKLTSLVRDMQVDIPGMKSQQRINTANVYGGPYLAVKTVNELLNLNISRYCLINYVGFGSLIDLIGGLELDISKGEASIVGIEYSEGPQLLNGWQTLTYAQIRKLDNNFGRNERQRKVLAALLDKAIDFGVQESLALMPEALRFISTNLTTSEILGLLPVVLENTKGVEMLSLPPDKAYHYGKSDDDSSVIIFNLEKTRSAFWEFISGETAQEQPEEIE